MSDKTLDLIKTLKRMQVYQSGKGRTTNSKGNWSTKEMARRECSRELWHSVAHIKSTEIVKGTPFNGEQDATCRWRFFIIITRIMEQSSIPSKSWSGMIWRLSATHRSRQYDHVLHISAEIIFGILRRWGLENECFKDYMMVLEEKRWRMSLMWLNEGLSAYAYMSKGLMVQDSEPTK